MLLCGSTESATTARCPSAGPGWPRRSFPTTSSTLPTARSGCASSGPPGRDRHRGRDRRLGRLASGPEHPRVDPRAAAVPEEDLDMLRFGESIGVDLVALSFVRTAEDIDTVRRHTRLPLIAKIEKPQAVDAAEEIIRAADCVMVARGDLGIELPIEDVPIVQKQLLRIAGRLARPSITATQMLDSMVASSPPDARRGDRRRQRDPRRHRRGHALAGDGDRLLPGRGGRDDGVDRRANRDRPAVPRLEREPRSVATRATPRTRSPTAPAPRRASSTSRRSSSRPCRAARRA